jgi:type IX secretion system PorP/SprF family membrane protein
MKKIYIISILLGILVVFQEVNAQQDPQYTQYMYNLNVINPAYAGSKESLSITALYRSQWVGIADNPETFTFSAHSPIGEKVGLGISAIKDQLGPVSESNIYADFSYTIDLGSALQLAFGIKGGVTLHEVGLSALELQDPNDPFFSEDVQRTYPNIGAGAFLYGENFYVSLSVPNFIESVHLDETIDGEVIKFGDETSHLFTTAGYIFQLGENIKLKPSAMVKIAFDSPISWDTNLNALFYEKFELGASYRFDDSYSALVGFQINPNLRIGYAYDHVISDIKAIAGSSHELILTWDVYFKKRALRSPRYF